MVTIDGCYIYTDFYDSKYYDSKYSVLFNLFAFSICLTFCSQNHPAKLFDEETEIQQKEGAEEPHQNN